MNRTHAPLLLAVFVLGLALAGCDALDIDDVQDPNGPSLSDILENPTRDKLANLAVGIEAGTRTDLSLYLINVGVVGREYYRFSNSDPRFVTELLGKEDFQLDNNTFYIARPWAARYSAIRNAYVLAQASQDFALYSEAERAAAQGYAQTWIAYQLLLNLNLTYNNGVRTDIADLDDLGPIVSPYDAAIANIAAILDEGAASLAAAGDAELPFSTTVDNVGSISLDTASEFRQFNRALAARIAAYRGDFGSIPGLLAESFFDADGDLFTGAYHVYSTGAGDLGNLMFYPVDASAGEIIAGHPSFVTDADPEDQRVFGADPKVALHLNSEGEPTAVSLDGLTSAYTFVRYESISAPIPIIRNAELILLQAEAFAQTGNLGGAVEAINVIRRAAGLDDFGTDAEDDDATLGGVLAEILRQRRYELYGEGHRWVDVRRYNNADCDPTLLDGGGCLNDDFPIDREGDDVWLQFPIPFAENV
ncbi:MAG: RagB/SusD family nutrient uptake outer membrane protein [Rhodothermales bacterium]